MVAAGVGLAAAAQLHAANEDLVLLLGRMAFPSSFSVNAYRALSSNRGLITEQADGGILSAVLLKHRKRMLWYAMERFSEFGKLCFFRGILTAVSRDTLNALLLRAPVHTRDGGESKIPVHIDEKLSKQSL
ncbi:hypothetical protein R1flu_026226 [Riccia fluitans]|uniref:Uncharacterized protein n=1 Tax=Riccia fluitans TaxID=41844 RepID=A0ABD1XG42_9MARC